jgi:hypothetical protein
VEQLVSNVFTQAIYGDEGGRRLRKLEYIYQKGNRIWMDLPEEERDAFFQLFLMKIHASYYMNHEFYFSDRSILSHDRGNWQSADRYIEMSRSMMDYRRKMLEYYNKRMNDGKWIKILTPEAFPPPRIPMYPAGKPALKISGNPKMKLFLWDGESVEEHGYIKVYQFGIHQKWFEIGNQGIGEVKYRIRISEGTEWLSVSSIEGSVKEEERIYIKVEEPLTCAGEKAEIEVLDIGNGSRVILTLEVEEMPQIPDGFEGVIEADGYLVFRAERYNRFSGSKECGFQEVKGIGRYEGSCMMAYNEKLCSLEEDFTKGMPIPWLEYNFFLTSSGQYELEIERYLTLNSKGRIRLGIEVDKERRKGLLIFS